MSLSRHNTAMENIPSGIRASRNYRKRRNDRMTQLEQGHRDIIEAIGPNDKPLALKLRTIAEKALS